MHQIPGEPLSEFRIDLQYVRDSPYGYALQIAVGQRFHIATRFQVSGDTSGGSTASAVTAATATAVSAQSYGRHAP